MSFLTHLIVNPMLLKAQRMGFLPPEVTPPIVVAGRLGQFVNTWKVLTSNPWVLQTVKGFRIPFTSLPSQTTQPAELVFPSEQAAQVREELQSLLVKGAVVPVIGCHKGFYSNIFLVPKKNSQMRPVINLKRLNEWVITERFKMEGISTLKDLLKSGDWFVKVDLKDAYFTVPIEANHQQYLRFTLEGKNYQFTCLPFGLSCAPRTFTKVLKPVMTLLRSWGVRIIVYIDDMLVLGESQDQASQHLETLLWVLQALGFTINWEKSVVTPTQQIEFLGLVTNSRSMELSLPGEKLRQIRGEALKILSQPLTSASTLSQLIGKLNAAAQAVVPAPLFYRHLQGSLKSALASGSHGYDNVIALSPEAQEELTWWQQHLETWNGRCLLKGRERVIIRSDASLLGWGATCEGIRTGGLWSELEKMWHINCLEMQAAALATQTFLKGRTGLSVLLQMDNTTAVAYINNLGGTVSPQLTTLAKTLWMWALQRDITLTAQHIPGVSNIVADTESRTVRDRTDWKLSPEIFSQINQIFGPLEVDLFASRLTHQLPRYFSWRPDPLAEATDAFRQDWRPRTGYPTHLGALWGEF